MKLILAGDVGGTKTNLALYGVERGGRLKLQRQASFPSRSYAGLEPIVEEFRGPRKLRIAAAAFGVAGPVLGGVVKTTNLPWIVRAKNLEKLLRCRHVRLLNDLEATAYGALFAPPRSTRMLARGKRRQGNGAVIAAGTGLGQALLFWDGRRHVPVATEGGHVDFAPRDETELALLVYLQKRFGRVSYERLLSGPGLANIFTFLSSEIGKPVGRDVRARLDRGEDSGAVVGEAGVTGACPTCAEAVDIFVRIYGAQAGNLALTVMAIGGVYIGGGIAAKLAPKLEKGRFMDAFLDKGRYRPLMSQIPVRLLLDPKTALLGAAHAAAE